MQPTFQSKRGSAASPMWALPCWTLFPDPLTLGLWLTRAGGYSPESTIGVWIKMIPRSGRFYSFKTRLAKILPTPNFVGLQHLCSELKPFFGSISCGPLFFRVVSWGGCPQPYLIYPGSGVEPSLGFLSPIVLWRQARIDTSWQPGSFVKSYTFDFLFVWPWAPMSI